MNVYTTIDPITRYVHVHYDVPAAVPDEISVRCEMRSKGGGNWEPVPVHPYVSDTVQPLLREGQWLRGILRGTVVERRAAGLSRTLVWNPFRQFAGRASVELRVTLLDGEEMLQHDGTRVELDNEDVVILDNRLGSSHQPDCYGQFSKGF